MAGAYETCNHVIACLYKIEFANAMGYCAPSCTEQACVWNQGTKREVAPKRITDLIVRKKMASSENKNVTPREEGRMSCLKSFDPRIQFP